MLPSGVINDDYYRPIFRFSGVAYGLSAPYRNAIFVARKSLEMPDGPVAPIFEFFCRYHPHFCRPILTAARDGLPLSPSSRYATVSTFLLTTVVIFLFV